MRISLIVALLATIVSGFVYAQADNEVICKSLINPDNVKVFEGKHCPFGWAKVNPAEDE